MTAEEIAKFAEGNDDREAIIIEELKSHLEGLLWKRDETEKRKTNKKKKKKKEQKIGERTEAFLESPLLASRRTKILL